MANETAATGVAELDRALGGLYWGDNVVWVWEAGELSSQWLFYDAIAQRREDFGAAGYVVASTDPAEVKARHILIRPTVDTAQVSRARLEADTVAAQWRAGVPFDTLAKKHHDYANKEDTSILAPFARDSLPASYQTAFASRKKDDIVVFPVGAPGSTPKFVVAQLLSGEEGGARTLEEMRELEAQQTELGRQLAANVEVETLLRNSGA